MRRKGVRREWVICELKRIASASIITFQETQLLTQASLSTCYSYIYFSNSRIISALTYLHQKLKATDEKNKI